MSKAYVDSQIAMRLLETPNATDRELAEQFNMSRSQFNRRKNSEAVHRLISEMLSSHREEIKRIGLKSLRKIEEHLNHTDPNVSLKATGQVIRLLGAVVEEDSPSQSCLEIVHDSQWADGTSTDNAAGQ